LDDARWAFLHEEALSAAVAAAFMHGSIYEKSCPDSDRLRVREGLKVLLLELGVTYGTKIEDEDHVKNIESLADAMTADYPECLRENRFRIGIAQKALNLYLKYLWCHGEIPTPPHCPFDSAIIGLLPPKVRKPYIKVDDINDYVAWVEETKELAKGKPLAVWELEKFENQRMKR
jgi:hypothetical protein